MRLKWQHAFRELSGRMLLSVVINVFPGSGVKYVTSVNDERHTNAFLLGQIDPQNPKKAFQFS